MVRIKRAPRPDPFRLVICDQKTWMGIDQMKPNLAQARRTCSSLLDPVEDTPVSNWIWVAKSISRSIGIVQPEHQIFDQTQNAQSREVRLFDSLSEP